MGHTVYHGVAKHVYFNKEVAVGLTLGLIAGVAWKWNHWGHRQSQQAYYAELSKKR
ncbi:Cytochrome c oxidase subunit Vc [Ostreococcus tauri]|uniref:Cytochrome c oxidase subunit Vc n=1 Tax=Ostreococcus tauri TaxID=70448 RepID=A0A096P9K2_OSTTA|nr:Cytochrome c oxidase subunit Vc [Ostreococcus tauri]OUS41861.1 hypothetical protein BE221DRAFT_201899 [Ostreococcus tauri]CEG01250.1 Cytochrome c oxidase subunit Vc [Ostreococcus tauri]|eukprot:XP_003080060.1 Cytochrome c oxidase subunit Vc [Ostreococcus tauri]